MFERYHKWCQRTADVRAMLAKKSYALFRWALTFSLSLVGVLLIAYGVYRIYEPAGFIAAGLGAWAIEWRLDDDESAG